MAFVTTGPEPIENALQEVSLETYSPQLFSQKLVAGTSCNQRRLGGGTVANYLGLWFRFETNSHESLWFQMGLIRAIGWIMMDIEGSTWLGPYASFLASVKKKCFFCSTNTHTQENHRAENNSISNGFLTRWTRRFLPVVWTNRFTSNMEWKKNNLPTISYDHINNIWNSEIRI